MENYNIRTQLNSKNIYSVVLQTFVLLLTASENSLGLSVPHGDPDQRGREKAGSG